MSRVERDQTTQGKTDNTRKWQTTALGQACCEIFLDQSFMAVEFTQGRAERIWSWFFKKFIFPITKRDLKSIRCEDDTSSFKLNIHPMWVLWHYRTLYTYSSWTSSESVVPSSLIRGVKAKPNNFFSPLSLAETKNMISCLMHIFG